MANVITCGENNDRHIQMSNGLTSVFINVLSLSGADLATTDVQKNLLIWLAQHDQSIFGIGCVSFDITTMCWEEKNFDEQKLFFLNVTAAALKKENWHRYEDYTPNEEWAFSRIEQFQQLIENFEIDDIDHQEKVEIYPFHPGSTMYDRCSTHAVYLYSEGCVICND